MSSRMASILAMTWAAEVEDGLWGTCTILEDCDDWDRLWLSSSTISLSAEGGGASDVVSALRLEETR